MENAWQLFLVRFSSPDPAFTYDEVCGWTAEEFRCLTDMRLIEEMSAPAKRVPCDACPKEHWEKVEWSADRKQAFIACPVAGVVDVSLERLRRWRTRPAQVALQLSRHLDRSGDVSLPAQGIWSLGRRMLAGHARLFFLAAIGPEELEATLREIRRAYGQLTSVLWVPFSSPEGNQSGKITVVDLHKTASLWNGQVMVDFQFIEEQLTEKRRPEAGQDRAGHLRSHRLGILDQYRIENDIEDMTRLASHVGVSPSALYGIVRGDRTRYAKDTLDRVLKKIRCTREKWDAPGVPACR